MVKFKISPVGTWEPLLDDIHLSAADCCGGFYSEADKLSHLFGSFDDGMPQSDIFVRTCDDSSPLGDTTQTPIEENHDNSFNANGIQAYFGNNNESSLSGCGILDSSEENRRKSLFGNTIHYLDSGDEQNSDDELYGDQLQDTIEKEMDRSQSNSTSLTLVNCSVTCLPLNNGQIHVTDRSTGDPQSTTIPLVDTKRLYPASNQQTYFYHGVPRSVGNSKHHKKKDVSATSLRSIGRLEPYDSPYRGVTRHKWTGKYEAHLWDGSCSAEGRTRKGKQVYLGGYETAEEAARAHDLAALKYWGPSSIAKLNFAISNYVNGLDEMECITREELVTILRRQSLSFTRGSSIYRGVTSRNRKGHWQARIKVASSKDIYLGTFSSEEEAARAYDIAAIRLKGINALTNFDISDYLQGDLKDLESIPQPKRVKRNGKVSALTSDTETDSQPVGSIPLAESPLDEIIRRKMSARLPDHPTAVLPN